MSNNTNTLILEELGEQLITITLTDEKGREISRKYAFEALQGETDILSDMSKTLVDNELIF